MNKSKSLTTFNVVSTLIGLPTLILSYMVPIFIGVLLIESIPWTLPLWLLCLAPVSLVLSVNYKLFKVATGGEEPRKPGQKVSRTEQLIYEILGAITIGFFIGATGLDIWAVYFSAFLLTFKLILGVILLIQSFHKTEPNP